MKKIDIKDLDPKRLEYRKPCWKNGHYGPNGYNVCLIGGICVACKYGLPPGPNDLTWEGVAEEFPQGTVYYTDEERRLAHNRRQLEWNKANRDTVYKNISRYNNSEERKAKVSAQKKEEWKNKTPEQRAAIYKKQRERYANLPPEEKEIVLQRQRDRYHRVKNKEEK